VSLLFNTVILISVLYKNDKTLKLKMHQNQFGSLAGEVHSTPPDILAGGKRGRKGRRESTE